jgi:DNA-binding transcriptional ArsR family regulator
MSTESDTGRFAYDGLERIIHERARLSILASLASHPKGLPFNDLKSLCSLTDGNLSRHMTALAEAGLVEIEKSEKNNRPLTRCRMSDVGRKRFLTYLSELENVLADAQQVVKPLAREGLAPA